MIRILLSPKRVELAWDMAKLACVGGKSHIRSFDRAKALFDDQLVGQLGTLAGHLYWFGNDCLYRQSRDKANANPTEGDGGSDIPGCNLDFKTSLMRASPDPLSYRLLVRPKERHPKWVYALLLVESLEKVREEGARLYLVGWASDDMLPAQEEKGVFKGAHVIPAKQLIPFPRLRWGAA